MVATLLERETDVTAAATDDEEHMKILSCLLGMFARDLKPMRGGSRAAQ
jgi:hypothetical protein